MSDTETTATDTNSTPSAPTGASADLTAIAANMAKDMPDVQEHAVAQAESERQAAQKAPTDKDGTLFDPSIHVTGPDGQGMKTVRGTWAIKRGRKSTNGASVTNGPGVTKSTLGGAAVPPNAQVVQQQQVDAQSRAAGIAAAEMLFVAGQVIGGEEWAPMESKALGMNERALMHQAFGDYFVSKGKTDVPPGAALAFCVIAYIAPRFAMPKTQTRFAKIKGAVVTWWVNRKLRKQGVSVQVEPKRAEGQKTKE